MFLLVWLPVKTHWSWSRPWHASSPQFHCLSFCLCWADTLRAGRPVRCITVYLLHARTAPVLCVGQTPGEDGGATVIGVDTSTLSPPPPRMDSFRTIIWLTIWPEFLVCEPLKNLVKLVDVLMLLLQSKFSGYRWNRCRNSGCCNSASSALCLWCCVLITLNGSVRWILTYLHQQLNTSSLFDTRLSLSLFLTLSLSLFIFKEVWKIHF